MRNLSIGIAGAFFLAAAAVAFCEAPADGDRPLGLSAQNGVLIKNGESYQGIGVNYFNLFYRRLKDNSDTSYRDGLRQLAEAGIPFVRFMCSGFWPIDWKLYLNNKEAYFAILDDVVKEAEKNRIGLIPSLFWHIPTIPDIVGEPMDQLAQPDSKTIAFIKRYTEEIVTRYKKSPAILGWEFVNEFNLHVDLPNADTHRPHLVPHWGTPKTRTERDEFSSEHMLAAFKQFAQTVRKYDKHRIVITGNSIPRPSAYHNTKEKSWKEDSVEEFVEILLRDNPDPFDTISIHVYPRENNQYSARATELTGLIGTVQRYARKAGKPLFIGEFGAPIQLGKDQERAAFKEIVAAIETHQVPLSALWVFDFATQNKGWNVTFDNDRAYMLRLISETNLRMQKRLKRNCAKGGENNASKADKRPNIVFFLIDDMGWKDLGCFGAKLYETPNIDKLCADGMRFPQAYTSTAICSPARATSMTGKHPMKLHMWNHHHFIPKGEKILAQYLKDAGYQTWHVGKWHMGNPDDQTLPTDLGFDANVGGWISWAPGSYFWPYGCQQRPDGKIIPKNPRSCVPGLYDGGEKGEYLTDRLTDEALTLLHKRDSSRPFFLNFWHYAVHNPKQAKPELLEKYKNKIQKLGLKSTYRVDPKTGSKLLTSETNAVYAAMIESVDNSIGRVIEKLKQIREYDNTLFIFYSDNGSTTDDVPCTPLNGGKNSTYEAGERVPAFMTWNRHIKPNSEYNHAIYLGDVFDTALAAAGVKKPENHDSDGTSLLPVFAGQKLPPRKFIWYFPDTRKHWAQRANAAIYDEATGMKYIMFFNGDADELYDIHNDIAEKNDIIEHRPDTATKRLRDTLIRFLNKYYADMPPPPDAYKAKVEQRLQESF